MPVTNTDGSLINNLAGYYIHYGTSSSALTQTIDINSAKTVSYVVTGLTTGTTYYFAVAAYNSTGIESAPSNLASKKI